MYEAPKYLPRAVEVSLFSSESMLFMQSQESVSRILGNSQFC